MKHILPKTTNPTERKTNMKQFISIITALLAAATLAQAYPLIVESPPGLNIVELQYGVMTTVASLHLPCRGKWTISGGAAVQINVNHPEWREFSFLYTAAAISLNENQLPIDGTAALDARPYGTGWFSADSRTHTILVDHDGADVFLVVQYWGQIPADYVQAFGSMIATIDLYD